MVLRTACVDVYGPRLIAAVCLGMVWRARLLVPKQEAQGALFCDLSLEDHVPQEHLLRSIDRFVDLSGVIY
tara:strand:+ start:220 stop:432 length:213 start_codon:yes stop_codon:yes gene_type:complete